MLCQGPGEGQGTGWALTYFEKVLPSVSDGRGDLGDTSEIRSTGFITSGILGESPHLSRPKCLSIKWAMGVSSIHGRALLRVVRRSRGTPGADPGVLGSLSTLKQLRALGPDPDPEASDLSSGRAAVSTGIAGPRGSLSTGSSRVNTQGPQPVKQRVPHRVTAAPGRWGRVYPRQSPCVGKEGLGGEVTQLSVLLRYLMTFIIFDNFKISFQEDPTT